MLKINIQGFAAACGNNIGGLSKVFVFDPEDMDWTQATEDDPYTAVAFRSGASTATGGGFREIVFQDMTGELTADLKRGTSSNSWEHQLNMYVPTINQTMKKFIVSLQKALICGQLGFVVVMKTGEIFVIGEKYINGDELASRFRVLLDNGTKIGSGKQGGDDHGATITFKGEWYQPLNQFTGNLSAITDMAGV